MVYSRVGDGKKDIISMFREKEGVQKRRLYPYQKLPKRRYDETVLWRKIRSSFGGQQRLVRVVFALVSVGPV